MAKLRPPRRWISIGPIGAAIGVGVGRIPSPLHASCGQRDLVFRTEFCTGQALYIVLRHLKILRLDIKV